MTNLWLEPGDIVLTRGQSFLARAIRAFSRRWGEGTTKVNHAGIITRGGPLWAAELTEALWRVKTHNLWKAYGHDQRQQVAIFRAKDLSLEERRKIAWYAVVQYQNQRYGLLKIVLHALDKFFGGRYIFRRLARVKRYPICSFLVADAYQQLGLSFNVEVGQAQPDDIWDYVTTQFDKYAVIYPLSVLEESP